MEETVEPMDSKSLSTLFKDGLHLFNNLGKIEEPTNSISVQRNVKQAMRTFENATRLVSLAGIFSKNESIDELSTEDLQYLLLPALLGSLSLKLTSGERKDIVNVAEIYFKDFLQRCNEYGLSDYEVNDQKPNEENKNGNRSEIDKLASMVNTRANKIQRYKEQKELKAKLETLKENLDNEHVDEEIKRDYYLTMIKIYIHEAIDELNSINMEKPILEHMANMKKDEKPKKGPQPQPLKPFIITKDQVQKAVYGAGYPSLPTMTVEEFYEKRVRDGIFPDPNKKPPGFSMQDAALAGVDLSNTDEEDKRKEEMEEIDDPEYIQRMRDKDEFKDEHRRGWGNRMNRS